LPPIYAKLDALLTPQVADSSSTPSVQTLLRASAKGWLESAIVLFGGDKKLERLCEKRSSKNTVTKDVQYASLPVYSPCCRYRRPPACSAHTTSVIRQPQPRQLGNDQGGQATTIAATASLPMPATAPRRLLE
jgi:hypothetical protein